MFRRPPSDVERMTSLRVDNLPYSAVMEDLQPLFERFGDVGDIYLPKVSHTYEFNNVCLSNQSFVYMIHTASALKLQVVFLAGARLWQISRLRLCAVLRQAWCWGNDPALTCGPSIASKYSFLCISKGFLDIFWDESTKIRTELLISAVVWWEWVFWDWENLLTEIDETASSEFLRRRHQTEIELIQSKSRRILRLLIALIERIKH